MDDNLLTQGIELMLFGMGTVIVFLTLLVMITGAMSALVNRFAPEPPAATPEPGAPVENQELLAVISAAIHQHRSSKKP